MRRSLPSPPPSHMAPLLLLLLLLTLLSTDTVQSADDPFALGPTKTSHLHFFFHDVLSGSDPSAINITASPVTNDRLGFGAVYMMDDPLTEGPNASSRTVGRAQGFYAVASKPGEEFALLITMNIAFVDGEFNGSSLAVVGRNNVLSSVRELPVVGGSGDFRMARGYAILRTRTLDVTTGDAVVEYDVYVQHYGSSGGGAKKEGVGGSAGGVVGGFERAVGLVWFICSLWVFFVV